MTTLPIPKPVPKSASPADPKKDPIRDDVGAVLTEGFTITDAWEWVRTNFLKTWFVSFLLHLMLLILLAVITLSSLPEQTISLLIDERADPLSETIDFPEIEFAVEESVLDTELTESIEDTLEPMSPDVEPMQTAELFDFGDISYSEAESMGEALVDAELLMKNDGPNFFAAPSRAGKIVFVVDNSNSMGRGRLETALFEMNKTIALMDKTQKFYILFYSDTAYRMFHPKSQPDMIPATDNNKAAVEKWLMTIERCLKTNGYEAIKIAAEMRPDVIYVLGDGAFTDKAAQKIVANPFKRVVIHTLGMEVSEKNSSSFREMAKIHRGTYKDVGVTPEGRAILERDGQRSAHRFRGEVWGKALPRK